MSDRSLILALDTTLGACSAALGDPHGGVLAAAFERRARGHAESIIPMIQAIFEDSGTARNEVAGIVCTSGPGSFTGLRVGLAAARGLALGLGVPAAGVPTLEVLAVSLLFDDKADDFAGENVLAVIDGPRDGFILQAYNLDLDKRRAVARSEISGIDASEAADLAPTLPPTLVGPAAERLTGLAGVPRSRAVPCLPDARVLVQYVLADAADRRQAGLSPIYFRPPHAKPAKPPPWVKPESQSS